MGFFDFLEGSQNEQQFQQVVNTPKHEASFGHEAIAGAASFAAVRAYEKHCAENGQPQNHALALEIIAGFAGAEVDKLIETKGLDEVDALKAKRAAKAQAAEALHQSGQYQGEQGYSRHGEYPEERYQGGGGGGYGGGQRQWGGEEREHYRQGPPQFQGGGGWEGGRGEGHGWGGPTTGSEYRGGPPGGEYGGGYEQRGGYEGGRY